MKFKKIKLSGLIGIVIWTLGILSDYQNTIGNTKPFLALITYIFGATIFYFGAILITYPFRKRKKKNLQSKSNVNTANLTPLITHGAKSDTYPKNEKIKVSLEIMPTTDNVVFPDWYVSLSFGKSASENYPKAVALAKSAPQYLEQVDDGKILHQAVYSHKPKEYLAFIMLYELVSSWKSTFVIINGQLIDRKIVGKLNYCYGDKCRSGNNRFCYGASYMTENPFGCHRLQISAANNPWWSFYKQKGIKWVLDKQVLLERINSYAQIYCICPCFDYENIIKELNRLPLELSARQMKKLADNNFGLRM